MPGRSNLLSLRGAVLAVVKVQTQTRIRIGNKFRRVLSWLDTAPVKCWMELGPDGGVRMTPDGHPVDKELADLPAEMVREVTNVTLQYIATRTLIWEVPLMYELERDRYYFHLPEEARALRILPQTGETAVVLAVRDSLQVWSEREWLTYVRGGLKHLDKLRELAAQELGLGEEGDE